MTILSLCGFLTIALLLWLIGYITPCQEGDYEMRLPVFIKAFYGRSSQPLCLRGFFLQLLGLVLAAGFLIEYLAFKFDRPVLVPAGSLFILCCFLIGIPGLIQAMIDHKRKNRLWKTLSGLSSTPLSGEEVHEIESAQQIQLERNWWQMVLVIFIFFIVLPLPLIWLITNQAIKAANAGEPMPGGWTWSSVVGFDILVLLVSLYLIWNPLKDMLTFFSEQGIRQPSWFGLRHVYLKWSQVEHLDNKYPVIRLIAPNQIIRLNILLFKHPETVMNEIDKHVPNSAL